MMSRTFSRPKNGDSVDEWMPVNIVPEQPRMGMLSSETPVCPSSITPYTSACPSTVRLTVVRGLLKLRE